MSKGTRGSLSVKGDRSRRAFANLVVALGLVCLPLCAGSCGTPLPPGTSGAGQGTGDLEPCLVGRWLHSHDEDTPDVLVYRPADYPFPREEGRDGFEILAGGEFHYLGIGRGDGTEVSNGRWTIEAPGRVRIDVNNKRVKPFWLEVISCDAETLKVKR